LDAVKKMRYRLFEPEDFDDLYAIEEVCFRPPHRFARSYMRQLVEWPDTATWVAEEDGQLAGFAIVEWSQQVGEVAAYIQTIEVLPQQRGQGAGGELMRRLEGSAYAEGAVEIGLHVDETNLAAIRLYCAQGYVNAGRTENYYARGRAAEIYSKRLKPLHEK
jgi:ribosomal-protein-alanine N-acetyltransferase